MFPELFYKDEYVYEFNKINDKEEIKNILTTYLEKYLDLTSQDVWFSKIKEMCEELGYASNMKEYKKNPDNFKGNVADVSGVLRVSLTKRSNTPDLYQIMKLLGEEKIKERFNKLIEK